MTTCSHLAKALQHGILLHSWVLVPVPAVQNRSQATASHLAEMLLHVRLLACKVLPMMRLQERIGMTGT
jgi:hypothetical protein